MENPRYCLQYNFHVYTVTFELKSVETRYEFYEKFEDLLTDYRKKKTSLFAGIINYNSDFKVYTISLQEQDISKLDKFL